MPNNITLASKMTTELDKLFVQSAVTGFMTDNAMRAKFVGAHTVLVPEMALGGLDTYKRSTGFAEGAINVSNTSYTLSQDRGRSFMLDAQDEDESGVANLAGQVLGEFVRTRVVPEVDAYCLSKLAGVAKVKSHAIGIGESAFADLRSLISKVRDAVGHDEALVAFLNSERYDELMAAPEIARYIRIDDFKKGEINTQIRYIDNVAILPVPSSRMKTKYDFLDSSNTETVNGFSEFADGFKPAGDAENIGMLVLPKKVPMLIRKTEKLRTFTPDQNQKADAYKFDYRLYYDLLVKKSGEDAIYASIYA